jgi:hypothetical protein
VSKVLAEPDLLFLLVRQGGGRGIFHSLLRPNESFDAPVAAAYNVDVDEWPRGFDEVPDQIAPRFVRCETRRNAR